VNRGEPLDPGFAESEALIAIDGDRLPPPGRDIEQQERRKENAEEAVQLTKPAIHKWNSNYRETRQNPSSRCTSMLEYAYQYRCRAPSFATNEGAAHPDRH